MKIPRDCNGAELARALRKVGYQLDRQTGSHIILTTQQGGEHHVTIPHRRPIKVGTPQDILKAVAAHHRTSVQDLLQMMGL